MSGEWSLDEGLDRVRQYVERIGDEVVGDVEGFTDENSEIQGFECRHGTHSYLALGSENWEHFMLQYPVQLDPNVAIQKIAKEKNIPPEEVKIDRNDVEDARDIIDRELSKKTRDELQELRLNLMQMLSREGLILNIDTTEPLFIHGFDVSKRIYIHEPDFQLSDFHHAVQSVINLGWVGKDFLTENYGLLRDLRRGDESQQASIDDLR